MPAQATQTATTQQGILSSRKALIKENRIDALTRAAAFDHVVVPSLSVVELHPLLVGQQVAIHTAAHVRIALRVNLLAKCLLVGLESTQTVNKK